MFIEVEEVGGVLLFVVIILYVVLYIRTYVDGVLGCENDLHVCISIHIDHASFIHLASQVTKTIPKDLQYPQTFIFLLLYYIVLP